MTVRVCLGVPNMKKLYLWTDGVWAFEDELYFGKISNDYCVLWFDENASLEDIEKEVEIWKGFVD